MVSSFPSPDASATEKQHTSNQSAHLTHLFIHLHFKRPLWPSGEGVGVQSTRSEVLSWDKDVQLTRSITHVSPSTVE